jgi:hypothetical protein
MGIDEVEEEEEEEETHRMFPSGNESAMRGRWW